MNVSRASLGTAASIAVFAIILLIGGADLLIQIHHMAASLTQVSTKLGTLDSISDGLKTMRAELAQTNRSLAGTNRKLDLTNAQLGMTNRKLDRTNSQLLQTNSKLASTNRSLSLMAATLQGMQSNISSMAKKLTHAKLLF